MFMLIRLQVIFEKWVVNVEADANALTAANVRLAANAVRLKFIEF